jgi:hypothetical protein
LRRRSGNGSLVRLHRSEHATRARSRATGLVRCKLNHTEPIAIRLRRASARIFPDVEDIEGFQALAIAKHGGSPGLRDRGLFEWTVMSI